MVKKFLARQYSTPVIKVLKRKRKKCYFKASPSYIARHWFKTKSKFYQESGTSEFPAFGIGQIQMKGSYSSYVQTPDYWPPIQSLSMSWFALVWSHRKLTTSTLLYGNTRPSNIPWPHFAPSQISSPGGRFRPHTSKSSVLPHHPYGSSELIPAFPPVDPSSNGLCVFLISPADPCLALRLYTVLRRGHQAHYKQASDILTRIPELEARTAVSQAFSSDKAGHGFGTAERTACHAAEEG